MSFQQKCTRFFIRIPLLMSVFFLGCKPAAPVPYDLYGEVTLRTAASNLAEGTEWASGAETLPEKDAYTEKPVRLPSGSAKFPETVCFAVSKPQKRVYPFLDGFTSLDTTNIPDAVQRFVLSVVRSCQKKELDAVFFPDGWIFLKTAADYELKDMPDSTRFVIGRAFIAEGVYEIPVRFFTAEGFFDAYLYVFEEKPEVFKLEQIIFEDAANGTETVFAGM